jgi:gamma-glutamylcyclotransferase (GGCT)/AIG2-like uncharacterized protein YtfP
MHDIVKPPKCTLMWAYGANLNLGSMAVRCPRAVPIRAMVITNAALVFRHVADVVTRKGSTVQGGLWRITDECERALDRFEGVSSNLYRKEYVQVKPRSGSEAEPCLIYTMVRANGVMPPGEFYLKTIADGYRDFGLDLECLDRALQESWATKEPTEETRRRRISRQDPILARNVVSLTTKTSGKKKKRTEA